MKRQYRTLMLEPQWHPIRWCRKHIRGDHLFNLGVVWLIAGLAGAFAPHPMSLAHWTAWRWVLAAFCLLPWIAIVAVVVFIMAVGIWTAILWFHKHPPFKIKTRWPTEGEKCPTHR